MGSQAAIGANSVNSYIGDELFIYTKQNYKRKTFVFVHIFHEVISKI